MKAAQINTYGGSDVVIINQNALSPVPTTGKVLVEVIAAGVNPIDWKVREGYMQQMVSLKFPATLGWDFSGIIALTGEGITNFQNGDEVFGQASILGGASGSFAEFALVNEKNMALKPKKISHKEAAALPLVACSAWQGIVDHIHLEKDQKILIHGGAGGIGTIAIQLAKHLGAFVATTATAAEHAYVKMLGADQVIDYHRESFEKTVKNFDAVFDMVGGETYEKSYTVLKKGGIIVSMLEQPRKDLMGKYGINAVGQFTQVTAERLTKIAELIDQGALKIHIDKIFPLSQAAEALMYLQNDHPKGKVVLEIKTNNHKRNAIL